MHSDHLSFFIEYLNDVAYRRQRGVDFISLKNYQSLPSTRFELFAGESFRIITSDLCTFL